MVKEGKIATKVGTKMKSAFTARVVFAMDSVTIMDVHTQTVFITCYVCHIKLSAYMYMRHVHVSLYTL